MEYRRDDKGRVRLTVAFPADVYSEIERLSKEEDRDYGKQVVHLCRIALKKRQKAMDLLDDIYVIDASEKMDSDES